MAQASGGKRLFTLSGVVPAAAFLVEHLVVMGSAMGGDARFERVFGWIANRSIFAFFELAFVLLPLGYHAIYGLYLTARPRDPEHTYASDGLYRLQRVTGVVVLAFLLVHFWELRLQRWLFGLDARGVYTRMVELLSSTQGGVPWVALFMLVGVAASVFHLLNGLWAYRAATERPSPALSRAFLAIGALFFLAGAATVISVATGNRLLPGPEPGKESCGAPAPSQ